MENLHDILDALFHETTYFCVVGNPRDKNTPYKKIQISRIDGRYFVEKFTQTQAFHAHMGFAEARGYLAELLDGCYRGCDAWDGTFAYSLQISKKGKLLFHKKASSADAPKPRDAHDREKRSLLPEGSDIPPLRDMGIFTKDGKIARDMRHKFRQINRFLEMIDDALKSHGQEELRILDFGCGKSYLTFIVYHYLTYIRGLRVHMTGLDLKAEVIAKCNEAARRYGYEHLAFEVGDIGAYRYEGPLDMVLTLHACDTATDYALFNAIRWKARMIFCVPCCQHELNAQMKGNSLLARHGIVRERFCALATDALRANLLEACGYNVQMLEFIEMEHTPKNIMIRAVRSGEKKSERPLREAEAIMDEYAFSPTLHRLLREAGRL